MSDRPLLISSTSLSVIATGAAAFYHLSLAKVMEGSEEAPTVTQLEAFRAALRQARVALGDDAGEMLRSVTDSSEE